MKPFVPERKYWITDRIRKYEKNISTFTLSSLLSDGLALLGASSSVDTDDLVWVLDFYSLSGRTSYRTISWRLEVEIFVFRLSNRSEIWQARRQQWYMSNFRAIRSL